MRILMIAPTPFFSDRGCHVRILNSYLRLKREKNDITLLTYPLGRDMIGIESKRVIKLPGYNKTSPGFSFYKPLLDIILLIKSWGEMHSNNYDLIYSHLHEGTFIGWVLKKSFGKKLIFDAQGSLTGEMSEQRTIKKNGILFNLLFYLEKFITGKPDEIITSTDDLKEFIVKNFEFKKPITVIKDLPDKSLFNKNIKPAKLKLPKSKKIVVYLGGLQEYKGIDYLIKAIPFISDRFHFLIMGYPEERCKILANELGVLNRITFTGKMPYELSPSYLKLGDLAVSPKTLESKEANAKIYNYLVMGLKVVCFDIPENRKILGNKGIYAKEKDIMDLAKKINGVVR